MVRTLVITLATYGLVCAIACAQLAPPNLYAEQPQPDATLISIAPIQEAVTGREELGDLSQPRQALAQFYRAINNRDLNLMSQNWTPSAEAVMDNPLGGIKRGWSEIRTVYERLFKFRSQYHFEFYDYTLHEAGDLFYVVGRERGWIEVDGTKLDLAVRTTRIFRKIKGRWQQFHHHGSIEDPKMLAAFQNAVP
jgi:ketosteroid isomerase-like protein